MGIRRVEAGVDGVEPRAGKDPEAHDATRYAFLLHRLGIRVAAWDHRAVLWTRLDTRLLRCKCTPETLAGSSLQLFLGLDARDERAE